MDPRSTQIVDELKALQSALADMPARLPFAIPDGYFREFAGQLQFRILLEESSASILDPIPVFGKLQTPFGIPEGYFDQFFDALKETLEVQALEARLPRKNVFEVPAGYFEGLSQSVMAAVQEQEEEIRLPGDLSKETPFEVPAGYFDQFAQNLQARLQAEESPKVIPLRPRPMLPVQIMRWAAAAVLILGVSVGIQQAGTPQSCLKTTRRALASIPENAIQEYVAQHADDFDVEMIEARLPNSTFQSASPVENLRTHEIQSFLSDEVLL